VPGIGAAVGDHLRELAEPVGHITFQPGRRGALLAPAVSDQHRSPAFRLGQPEKLVGGLPRFPNAQPMQIQRSLHRIASVFQSHKHLPLHPVLLPLQHISGRKLLDFAECQIIGIHRRSPADAQRCVAPFQLSQAHGVRQLLLLVELRFEMLGFAARLFMQRRNVAHGGAKVLVRIAVHQAGSGCSGMLGSSAERVSGMGRLSLVW
jgi:hypothetical protein